MLSITFVNGLGKSLVLAGVGISLLTSAGVTSVGAHDTAEVDMTSIREATTAYQDVSEAETAGYALLADKDGITCIDNADEGTMGIHYANGDLVAAGEVDALKPQVLVYEPGDDDELNLVGVEYVVFQDGWDAAHDAPPTLFGEEFMLTSAENRYGLPAFYSLHAWAWKTNPSGDLAMWNPDVSCS